MRVLNDWNSLPEAMVLAPIANSKKGRFDRYFADKKLYVNVMDEQSDWGQVNRADRSTGITAYWTDTVW
jgi:hypothetical protein